jgi:hypothetical protein
MPIALFYRGNQLSIYTRVTESLKWTRIIHISFVKIYNQCALKQNKGNVYNVHFLIDSFQSQLILVFPNFFHISSGQIK